MQNALPPAPPPALPPGDVLAPAVSEGPPQSRAGSRSSGQRGSRSSSKERSSESSGPGRPAENVFEAILRIFRSLRAAKSRNVDRFAHKCVAARPICLILVILVVAGTIAGLGVNFKPPKVDTNLDAFMKADINSSVYYDAFVAAREARTAGNAPLSTYRVYDMVIAYELKDAGQFASIFDFEVLLAIGSFEQQLRDLPKFQDLCASAEERHQGLCSPGISLVNYMMPTQQRARGQVVPTQLNLDGRGRDTVPLAAALRLLDLHGLLRGILPRTFDASLIDAPMAVTTARSIFRFKLPLNSDTAGSQLDDLWKDFLRVALPWLEEITEKGNYAVQVYLTGDLVEDVQVLDTLKSDLLLAVGSLCFVLVYMVCHTRSFFLAFIGLVIYALTMLLAYIVFAVCVTESLSISCFIAVFFLLGLVSDTCLVYVDVWRDSDKADATLGSRVAATYQRAGQITFAAASTLIVSFLSCLASKLRPLRELGMLLALGTLFAWMLPPLLFMPCCIIYDRHCAGCRVLRCFGESKRADLAERWSWALFKLQLPCVAFTVITGLTFLVVSLLTMDTNMSMPNVFPEGHNQHRGQDVMGDNFEALLDVFDHDFGTPPEAVEVCAETNFDSLSNSRCSMFWCDVGLTVPQALGSSVECRCYRRKISDCGTLQQSPTASLVHRYVGLTRQSSSSGQLLKEIGDNIESQASASNLGFVGDRAESLSSRNLKPLLLHEWESGDSSVEPVFEVKANRLARKNAQASCGWQELCFCNGHICNIINDPLVWRPASTLTLTANRRLSSSTANSTDRSEAGGTAEDAEFAQVAMGGTMPLRRLAVTPESQSGKVVSVVVVFGITVEESTPLLGQLDSDKSWSFLNSFQARHPRAQRDMYTMCTTIPSYLRVRDQRCWIELFQAWLQSRGSRFPVPMQNFDALALKFAESYPSNGAPYLWIRDGEVKASYVEFSVDLDKAEDPKRVREYMSLWDRYLEQWNAAASPFSRGAWHASSLWRRGEAERKLVISVAVTMSILVPSTIVVILLSTTDFVLTLFVLYSTAWIMSTVFFFMTTLFGWEFGPIEMISILASIGYAYIFSLHLINLYASEEAEFDGRRPDVHERAVVRYRRASYALRAIGGAVTGSAVAMAASTFFLLFCTLKVLSKLGAVILVTSLVSLVSSLGLLPAFLLLAGPKKPTCRGWRWCQWQNLPPRIRAWRRADASAADEMPLQDGTAADAHQGSRQSSRQSSKESGGGVNMATGLGSTVLTSGLSSAESPAQPQVSARSALEASVASKPADKSASSVYL